MDDRGSVPRKVRDISLSHFRIGSGCQATSWIPKAVFVRVKWPGREADHGPSRGTLRIRGNISPLHRRFYVAVLILLQSFGYTAVVFGMSRVSAVVRVPLKGFS